LLDKIRYLRHPYLITRAFSGYSEIKESQKHRLRLEEYDQYVVSLEKGVEILTGLKVQYQEKLINEIQTLKFLDYINRCLRSIANDIGMDRELVLLLYLVVRVLKPNVVVETGVANGVSSSIILKALDQNGKGVLYSLDLHYREGIAIPRGKHLGWIIPDELRNRWRLVLGESTKVLPKLLNSIGSIDMFLHDSRHTYKTMIREYEIAYPFLKDRGLLLSHDVKINDAFLDFSDKIKRRPLIIGNIGVIKK